jgi:hypothetical protein
MSTPRDLARDTWIRVKQLVLLNGALEDYILLGVAKVWCLAIGLAAGWYLWGAA